MELYLIRHGETDYNKERKIQGSCDIPLNEYGRELARETAEGLKDIPFDGDLYFPILCRPGKPQSGSQGEDRSRFMRIKGCRRSALASMKDSAVAGRGTIFPMEELFLIPSSLIQRITRHHQEAKALRM